MLNQLLIEKLASDLKIAPLNIIREYFEMEILFYLSQTNLSKNIIFYGGTALRLAHKSFRFSEDLDFLLVNSSQSNIPELKQALQLVKKNNSGAVVEEVIEKRSTIFALLHIQNELLKHPIRIKIEISKKTNGIKSENLLLVSPTSTKEIIFHTVTLESLFKLKEAAIKNRNMPRDWFDLWYLSQKLGRDEKFNKNLPFKENEFSHELKRWLPKDKWPIISSVIKYFNEK